MKFMTCELRNEVFYIREPAEVMLGRKQRLFSCGCFPANCYRL